MKLRKTADTDYLYASAHIRAVQSADSMREKVERMLNAADFYEAAAIFCPNGADDINSGNYQDILDAELIKSYDFVTSMIGNSPIVSIFKYPYDCNNLKLAFKSELCGAQVDELYYPFATVSVTGLKKAMRERDFSEYPDTMAQAASQLTEFISKNPDPQLIDIVIDRACLEDMMKSTVGLGCEYLSDIIKTKMDSYNILSFIRCVRMKKSGQFYKNLTVSGGNVPTDTLIVAYDSGLDSLAEKLKMTVYSSVSDSIAKYLCEPMPGFFSSVEKELESIYTSRTDEVKFISFGPEIPLSYLIECERDIKNAGIILAGKSAGLDNKTIRGRLRT